MMKKATQLFNKDEITSIEAAIVEVEKSTSAEVVPVITSVSGRYDRAEDLFAFLFSLGVLTCAWLCCQGVSASTEAWSLTPRLTLNLAVVLAILAGSYFLGIALASHLTWLRLPFISKSEMKAEVERSARETFQQLKIRGTQNATGLLIYVSLYEHMVHVEGDETINAHLSSEDWKTLSDIIISGFKNGKPEKGMRKGILSCGELLAQQFPIRSDDENELFDTLHLID